MVSKTSSKTKEGYNECDDSLGAQVSSSQNRSVDHLEAGESGTDTTEESSSTNGSESVCSTSRRAKGTSSGTSLSRVRRAGCSLSGSERNV